jgi:DNA invertase Pin-like site-specific DNA recombinase
VGYIRVSTTEQADSGAGLEAQRRAIAQACEARGWDLVGVFDDPGLSGKNLNRPGLIAALEMVETGRASVLVVAKLDRLSRSLIDFAGVMERSRKRGWHLAALDLGVDTSTPQGELVASVMATFAQFERRLIGLRTKEALAVKRSQGIRLGRPPAVLADTVQHIRQLRESGLSYREIGSQLDAEGQPTPHGGQCWHPNTVRRILGSHEQGGRR